MNTFFVCVSSYIQFDGVAFLPDPAWFNSGNTIGGLDGGASFWLFRISISLDATWSTVAPKIAPTISLSVDLITTFTVSPFFIASLPAFEKVWAAFISTGLRNLATFGINFRMPCSTSPNPWPYWYLEVTTKTVISKPLPCCKKAAL